jgi:predicted alpha/beta hydrolase family esterase
MNDRTQLLFIHGGEAYSSYGDFLADLASFAVDPFVVKKRWRTRLQEDLGGGFEVFLPEMPNKMNAKYTEWKIWFAKYLPFLRDGVYLAGHSLGGCFLAKYLTEEPFPVRIGRLYLISAPFGNGTGSEGCGDFLPDPRRLPQLAERADSIVLIHAKNDQVVPFTAAESYSAALPSARTIFPERGGHFIGEAFSEFLQDLRS